MKTPLFCLGAFVLATASCKRGQQEIQTYKVAKTPETSAAPAQEPHAGMPGGVIPGGTANAADPHAGVPGMAGTDPHTGVPGMAGMGGTPSRTISDTPPAHWEKGASAGMRVASYLLKGEGGETAVVTLSNLRAAPASRLNGINMWKEQLGQAIVDDAAITQLPVAKTGFGDGVLVEVAGTNPSNKEAGPGRLIGAIVEEAGTAWYFKLVGDAALVAAERTAFLQWMTTVKASEPAKIPMHGSKPGDAGAAPVPLAAAASASDGSVTWTLPAGWVAAKGNPARYATLAVTGADGAKGELAVTHFQGDVGGDLANVNRWRGQIGLAPITEAELTPSVTKVTAGPKAIQIMDATGPQMRCTAGWVKHGGETWFFKFTGPDALVGGEKAKFAAFLESVRFTKPE